MNLPDDYHTKAGKQLDYDRRADDLKAGNPGLTDESVAFGLRRAREIFERRYNPIKLELGEVQLAAIMAGAHHNGFVEGREFGQADMEFEMNQVNYGGTD